mgnify:CR=1 FL=1
MEEDKKSEAVTDASQTSENSEQPAVANEAANQESEAVPSQEELPLPEKAEDEPVVVEEITPATAEAMADEPAGIIEEPAVEPIEESENTAAEEVSEETVEAEPTTETAEEASESIEAPADETVSAEVLTEEPVEEIKEEIPATEPEADEFRPFTEEKKEINKEGDKSMAAKLMTKKNLIISAVAIAIIALVGYVWKQNSDSEYGNYGDVNVQVSDNPEQGKVNIIEEVNDDISTLSGGGSAAKPATTEVVAFFGNTQKDPGTQDCSRVFALKRQIAKQYDSNMLNSVLGLIEPLTAKEKEAGYISLVPEGTALRYIKLDDSGVAMANFSGGIAKTAGSCAVTAIKAQIRATLMQFSAVKSVVICVDDNCQEDEILQP